MPQKKEEINRLYAILDQKEDIQEIELDSKYIKSVQERLYGAKAGTVLSLSNASLSQEEILRPTVRIYGGKKEKVTKLQPLPEAKKDLFEVEKLSKEELSTLKSKIEEPSLGKAVEKEVPEVEKEVPEVKKEIPEVEKEEQEPPSPKETEEEIERMIREGEKEIQKLLTEPTFEEGLSEKAGEVEREEEKLIEVKKEKPKLEKKKIEIPKEEFAKEEEIQMMPTVEEEELFKEELAEERKEEEPIEEKKTEETKETKEKEEKLKERFIKLLTEIKGVGPKKAKQIYESGFTSLQKLREAKVEEIAKIEGITKRLADQIKREVLELQPKMAKEFDQMYMLEEESKEEKEKIEKKISEEEIEFKEELPEWLAIDKSPIDEEPPEWKAVEEGYKYEGYTLYEVPKRGFGRKKKYIFSKTPVKGGKPCQIPDGYVVKVKKGVPSLEKVR